MNQISECKYAIQRYICIANKNECNELDVIELKTFTNQQLNENTVFFEKEKKLKQIV